MRLARLEGSKSFHIFLSAALFSAHDLSRLGTSLKIELESPVDRNKESRHGHSQQRSECVSHSAMDADIGGRLTGLRICTSIKRKRNIVSLV